MKKSLLLLALGIMTFVGLQAQETATADESKKSETAKSYTSVSDYYVGWSDKSEIFSFNFGGSFDKYSDFTLGFNFGFGDFSVYECYFGFGLQKRYFIDNAFLIQAKLYPYVGYGSYEYETVNSKGKKITEDESEFLWGAMAQFDLGLKIFTTKKGNDCYVTVGYMICAPELETDGMFDNGSWRLGLTMAF